MGISEIAERYELHFILLFGSGATGTATDESDVDVAVYGRHILTETEKIELVVELSPFFKTEKIDLVDIKTAPPLLRKKIFDAYKVIYLKDASLLYQIELTSLYEYKEQCIIYEMRHERLKEALNDR